MNKILVVSLCLVVFSIILFYAMGFNVENIATNEIRNKLNSSDANIGIIDVRTKSEYESGHIENSLWIPLSQLESNIEKIKSKNYDEIYTICLSGGRSASAVKRLKKHDINAINIRGGMLSWNSLK
jgi:phage shock protein E